jgi:uncharacterized tannase-like protein DUF6351
MASRTLPQRQFPAPLALHPVTTGESTLIGRSLVAAVAVLLVAPAAASAAPALSIDVISNRADLISAGDALVAIDVPDGVDPASVTVTEDGRDVTDAFAQRPNGRFEGRVTGLDVGANELRASAPAADPAAITIANHPNGGPVLSGPQIQPWVCTNGSPDPQCDQPATYRYEYKSSLDGRLHSYDPDNPPADVAQTTTQTGHTVPFIIRIETGYQDRDQYQIATLFQPNEPWEPWAPQPQFNHKLLITHGASCGIDRQSGTAPSVTGDTVIGDSPTTALGEGFAVLSTALNNAGHNCNLVTQAESMIMAKERFVEQYGEIRYTIGTGCSGGSLTQQQVANAYPGIYQGILPACSFPDAWSTGQQLSAYNLIRRYVEDPTKWAPGVVWDPLSIAAVEGHPNHVNSIVFDSVYWTDLGVPDDGCAGVPDDQVYDAETNPQGVRCTLADLMINVFGPRAPQNFAGIPLDNVGVQWGLEALRKGQITPAQFVDLNEKTGGLDVDAQWQPQRTEADATTLRRAYRSGAINTANNLDRVAIIDLRGPDPGAFHDAYRSWAIRARLEREHGHFDNQVIWFGQVPLIGDPRWATEAMLTMDRWLEAVEADATDRPLPAKIVANRPPDLRDRCSQIPGLEQVGAVCEHEQLQTRYGTPATVAGESIATDTNKCALKPLRRADYYPVAFTNAQWARLQRVFATGVCDWSRPGPEQQGAVPWQTYQEADGTVIYGGRALDP